MERDQLITEVARTTGVRLDRSDPILAAAAVNEALLHEALVKLDRQVKLQADRIAAASAQAVVDAERQAANLLTDAGVWLDARLRAAGEAAAAAMLAELKQEIRKAEKVQRTTVRIAWTLAICALIAFSGGAGLLLAGVPR